MTTENQAPETQSEVIQRYKIGRTQATIWANQTENGMDHGVSLEQRYRDSAGIWRSSHFYRLPELLALRELVDQAIAGLIKLQTPDT